MRSYLQYCPVAKAAEVIGDRWSILIMRDLLLGATHFNELARGLPGLSRSLLASRLRYLETAGLLSKCGREYHLTPAGADLREVVFSMGEWAARWAFRDPEPDDLNPELLAWWIHNRIATDEAPGRRIVVELDFRDPAGCYWLVIESGSVSVCFTYPGFEVDLWVRSDCRTMYLVWLGRVALSEALRGGSLELAGDAALVEGFPRWLQMSPMAPAVSRAISR
jgi:DNA-binding HxlR family transcriptional regulator